MGVDLVAGQVVGRYRIVRTIARGGMGVTYEGESLSGRQRVAVKELGLSRLDDWKVMDLFEREARVLALVKHPAVPAYVDHFAIEGAEGPTFYLVQQIAPGHSLAQLVAGGWRADEAEARRIAAAILDVLDHLHALVPPVYHRDIKPQNVLREDTGKVWVVDFGAVRDVYRSTQVGGSTVAGTFGYMAPEQLRGIARPESDLYGLGATLLYVLSGQTPAEMPQSKLKADFRSRVRVSPAFAAWLDKMLEPAPEDRFRSAVQALKALEDPTQMPGYRSSKRAVVLGGILAALLLSVGAGGMLVKLRAARSTPWAMGSLQKLPERPGDWKPPAVKWVKTIQAHFSGVMDVTFTPDGTRLLTSSFDDSAKIWDVRTGEAVRALPGHTKAVGAVRVTPDGRYAVTAGDQTLRVWSLPDGKPVRTIDTDTQQVFTVAISPDGRTLVSGHTDGAIKVWTLEGRAVATLPQGGGRVFSIAFAPDGSRFAAAGDGKEIKIWSTGDWKLQHTLLDEKGGISRVAIAPDGQTLASGGDDHSIRLWHIESGHMMATLALHTEEVWALAFSPDGATLVSGGKDSVLGVWDLLRAKLKQKWPFDAPRKIMGLAFAPDGLTFAAAYASGTVDLFRLAKSGTHAPIPSATLVERQVPSTATAEQRAYAEAMVRVDRYSGDRRLLDEAEALLEDMRKANSRSALALAGLARVAFRRSALRADTYDPDLLNRALELSSQAISLDPTLPDGYVVRGFALNAKKDAAGARAAAAMALKLAPTMIRAQSLAETLAEDSGDLDGAEKILRNMLSRPIEQHWAGVVFGDLATLYEKAGDLDAAGEARRREVDLEPESAWAKGNYASFLIRKGDYEGAIGMAKQALSQMDYGAARLTLADAYCLKGEEALWDRGETSAARQAFDAATAADARDYRAAYDLGAYHQFLGVSVHDPKQMEQAKQAYEMAASLDPSGELSKKALKLL
jgi:WD40 repeat protein